MPDTIRLSKIYGREGNAYTIAGGGGGSSADPHALPAPSVSDGLVGAYKLTLGDSVTVPSVVGNGQSLVLIPRKRFENEWLNRFIMGRGTSNYGIRYTVTNAAAAVDAKLETVGFSGRRYSATGYGGTASFQTTVYRAVCYETAGTGSATSDTFSCRAVYDSMSVEKKTVTAGRAGSDTYHPRTFTSTFEDVALLIYNRTITDEELVQLTRQYTYTGYTQTADEIASHRYCLLTMDDLEGDIVDHMSLFTSRGIRPTFGLRMDYIGTAVNTAEILRLQSMGCEIAFHGYTHDGTSYNSVSGETGGYNRFDADRKSYDINKAFSFFDKNGIECHGFIGPNVAGPVSSQYDRFLWYRYSGPTKWNISASSPVVTFGQQDFSMSDAPTAAKVQEIKDFMASVNLGQAVSILIHTYGLARVGDKYDAIRTAWEGILDYMIGTLNYRFISPTQLMRLTLNNSGDLNLATAHEVASGNATTPHHAVAGT